MHDRTKTKSILSTAYQLKAELLYLPTFQCEMNAASASPSLFQSSSSRHHKCIVVLKELS